MDRFVFLGILKSIASLLHFFHGYIRTVHILLGFMCKNCYRHTHSYKKNNVQFGKSYCRSHSKNVGPFGKKNVGTKFAKD